MGVFGNPIDHVGHGPEGVDAEGDYRQYPPDYPVTEQAEAGSAEADLLSADDHALDDVGDDQVEADREQQAEGEDGD